ncbi:unnamed protein product [Phytophthora fragariaefolia]|uniref:Unnamed protein product n=1 Tax=Phytophthora fragariaefolia TaxID=1490495 RepID=A0A9W6X7C5_9STRA|nr:unnamed protein product [Phytophthora fragariaefolia]
MAGSVRVETLIAKVDLAEEGSRMSGQDDEAAKVAQTPTTRGESIDKASKIDDSNYNVALGMMHIGQPWAMAETKTAAQMHGTAGTMQVIPGIDSTPVELWRQPTPPL